MRNAVDNWNDLVGRTFEFIGNNLGGVVGTIVKLHYHGSFNDGITFVEVQDKIKQKPYMLESDGPIIEETGNRLIMPDSITQLKEIK